MRVQDECKAFVGQCLCSSCLKSLQLQTKIIAFMPQFHCFYCPKAVSLQSGMNGDEKELNRREKRMGYIEAVKE
jgi:hypothetical protein